MVLFDYSREPHSDIAFVDMKSFYASCECIVLGLDPLKTSLCVMSRIENSAGLILAATPLFKKNFGSQNVSQAIIFLLMSTPVSSTMLLPTSRDFLLQQIMFVLLKTLPKRSYWSPFG